MSDFKKIGDISVKDTELRNGISTLRSGVLAQTIKPLSVTKNGTYMADVSAGAYGYSPIIVNVVEPEWEPLEDGYNNFWVTLTDVALSPVLNMSGRTGNAVIDWGDGTPEESISTNFPTHTYNSAGEYIIKVKGLSNISTLFSNMDSGLFLLWTDGVRYVEIGETIGLGNNSFKAFNKLKKVSCNSTTIGNSAFNSCPMLSSIELKNTTSIGNSAFYKCGSLVSINIPNSVTSIGFGAFSTCPLLTDVNIPISITTITDQLFESCTSLSSITIPNSVTSIGNMVFYGCISLSEVHMQSTTPPTLGMSVFDEVSSDFVIYVPVGCGSAYKSASEWSDYSDHIQEEQS